jgi:2-polyprenyl-6-hydroxyphenyl methylase/3-demethylubiquinone-9 3-methyltransferase
MSTLDPNELARFEQMAEEWWDPQGRFKPLHQINPIRTGYVCEHLVGDAGGRLDGLCLLDIGCGGGILSESLAERGARVTAIDRSEKIIAVAQAHQRESGSDVAYRVVDTGLLATEMAGHFDAVLAMEVLEHVSDVGMFLQECTALVKPGGKIFFATINQTWRAWLFAIAGAEYVLRWLPRGTHQFDKLVRPSVLVDHLRRLDVQVRNISGMSYHPLRRDWYLSPDTSVNYLGVGVKAGVTHAS